MKLVKSSLWFELDNPIGEPDIEWNFKDKYWIERRDDRGNIVWFGQGVNWLKKPKEEWKVLGADYVTKTESVTIWIPCEEPIYEILYQQMLKEEK